MKGPHRTPQVIAAERIIGGNIRLARQMRGMRIADFATVMDSDSSTISKLERGQRSISVWFLLTAAEVLGVSYQSLVSGDFIRPDRPDFI